MPDPRAILAELATLEASTVVDVGCGDGDLVRWLAGQGAQAIGVEVGEEPLRAARAAPPVADERYELGGAEALPLPDASADVATFIQSLHHVPVELMDQALAEVARVLRPGGLFVHETPVAQRLAHPIRSFGRTLPWGAVPELVRDRAAVLWAGRRRVASPGPARA